jgi:hypothetical protein
VPVGPADRQTFAFGKVCVARRGGTSPVALPGLLSGASPHRVLPLAIPSPLPVLAVAGLLASGVVLAPVVAPAWAPRAPWDAPRAGDGGLPEETLAPQPTDALARLRWVGSRRPGDDRAATVSILSSLVRWGRGRPRVCLEGAGVAWMLWRSTGDTTCRAVGNDLLRTYLRRSPSDLGLGFDAWRRLGDTSEDPLALFGDLPSGLAAIAGGEVADRDPVAAWALLRPLILDTLRPWEEVEGAVRRGADLARTSPSAEMVESLRRAVDRPECPPDLRRAVEALAAPGPGRR